MKTLANSLLLLGSVLLAHAAYSTHEHSTLPSRPSAPLSSPSASSSSPSSTLSTSATSAAADAPLPLDITIETLVSLVFLVLGIVLRSPQLRPVQWRVWAGRVEREGGMGVGERGELVGNVYLGLEERVGMWDIRAKRREFAEWVKEGQISGL